MEEDMSKTTEQCAETIPVDSFTVTLSASLSVSLEYVINATNAREDILQESAEDGKMETVA